MGCGSCGTTSGGCAPAGCQSNGNCSTGGCNAINSYDWFGNMVMPEDYKPFDVIEVKFKGRRKEFVRNSNNLEIYKGDFVKLKADGGFDIVAIGMTGELVRLQLKKHKVDEASAEMRVIEGKISESELEKYLAGKDKEPKTLERARTIALQLKLAMKLSDIEIRGDGKRVIFFYTAENRVDFRELIRQYADEFKMRIEMRQIGYREEASRLGGIGSCGRELCCSTWLTTHFNMVNTQAARYQNLSINMLKLSGQCGKLKCCLNFELDTYIEATNEFPKQKTVRLDTEMGTAYSTKVDILKRQMWFAYEKQNNWIPLDLKRVNEILAMNKAGQKAPALIDEQEKTNTISRNDAKLEVVDLIEDTDIKRFDKKIKLKDENNNNRRNNYKGNKPSNQGNKNFSNRNNNNNPAAEGAKTTEGGKPAFKKPFKKKTFKPRPKKD